MNVKTLCLLGCLILFKPAWALDPEDVDSEKLKDVLQERVESLFSKKLTVTNTTVSKPSWDNFIVALTGGEYNCLKGVYNYASVVFTLKADDESESYTYKVVCHIRDYYAVYSRYYEIHSCDWYNNKDWQFDGKTEAGKLSTLEKQLHFRGDSLEDLTEIFRLKRAGDRIFPRIYHDWIAKDGVTNAVTDCNEGTIHELNRLSEAPQVNSDETNDTQTEHIGIDQSK